MKAGLMYSPSGSGLELAVSACMGITTTRLRTFRLRHFVYRHFVYRQASLTERTSRIVMPQCLLTVGL